MSARIWITKTHAQVRPSGRLALCEVITLSDEDMAVLTEAAASPWQRPNRQASEPAPEAKHD